MRYHKSAGRGGRGWSKGEIEKFGGLIFFTVFEYKTDMANTSNNSRIFQIGDLSQ